MKLENNLISRSTNRVSPLNFSSKLKKGSDANESEAISIDPYLLSIKLKKAIPSIDKDITDLNETICHLIYSNKTVVKEVKQNGRSRSRKVNGKPPIFYNIEKNTTTDSDRNVDDSAYESNIKSPSTDKLACDRLSREAKFYLEKKRNQLRDVSVVHFSKERNNRSRSRKHPITPCIIPIMDQHLNVSYKRDSSHTKRGISSHSRSRAPSNLRASSKANFTDSRHHIQMENHENLVPDFPIPLPNESSEFIILPPKVFFQNQANEQINYEIKSHHHHHHHHSHNNQQQKHHHNYPPVQHSVPQNYPGQQFNQQMEQVQYYQQQIPQLPMQQQQQIQYDLTPQQVNQLINATPMQQAEILNQMSQQAYANQQAQQVRPKEMVPQLQQPQNVSGISPNEQLELTLQKLQHLYINQPVQTNMDFLAQQQIQQQNQHPDLALQQYLALKSQNNQVDLLNANQQLAQQQLQQQMQNLINLQKSNVASLNQQQQNQYFNQLQQEIQLAAANQPQQGKQQFQYINYASDNNLNAAANLQSAKMPMNFLGMVSNQHLL